MKKILFALALVAGCVIGSRAPARAAVCTVPYVFSNGTVADATQVNAEFNSLLTCSTNIDNTNVGTLGFFATQIKPTTVAQAVFGGIVGYTFPTSITLSGLTTAGVVLNSAAGLLSSSAGPLAIANGGTGTTTGYAAGPLPISAGGTGSTTQNFVDLTTAQTVAGAKTFSGSVSTGALASTSGNVTTAGTFLAGSSGYGPTSATILGTVTATTFAPTASNGGVNLVNVAGGSNLTAINNGGGTAIAGITNTAFGLAANGVNALLSVNAAGSMGITGSYFSASRRELKNHISEFTGPEALRFIGETDWAKFAYKTEHAKTWRHLGLIANDSPEAFAGAGHDHIEISAVATAAAVAVHYQQKRIDDLEARLARLEAKVGE